MVDLDAVSESLNVSVIESSALVANGVYIHEKRLIILRKGLDYWTYRSTLAHELGHAYYGDVLHDDPVAERRADRWAARLLISAVEYQLAEQQHDGHVGAIAHDLGVTPHLVGAWKNMPISCRDAAICTREF